MNSSWIKVVTRFTKENAPTILTGLACAGVVGTVVLAVRATPEATEKLADALREKEDQSPKSQADEVSLTALEIIKAGWMPYIPAAVAGLATIACIIGANRIGVKRYAAMAGAYGLLERGFREYKDKVLGEIGEKKEQAIRDKIAEDRINATPVRDGTIVVGTGEVMCYDMLTGRYFKSSHEDIRRAENDLNREVLQQGYCDQNKFYELLGLAPVDIGDEVGWNLDHKLEIVFSSVLNDCGIPCLAIGYRYPPRADFGKIF
jgi:Family of unknown function (DUF6353)